MKKYVMLHANVADVTNQRIDIRVVTKLEYDNLVADGVYRIIDNKSFYCVFSSDIEEQVQDMTTILKVSYRALMKNNSKDSAITSLSVA